MAILNSAEDGRPIEMFCFAKVSELHLFLMVCDGGSVAPQPPVVAPIMNHQPSAAVTTGQPTNQNIV